MAKRAKVAGTRKPVERSTAFDAVNAMDAIGRLDTEALIRLRDAINALLSVKSPQAAYDATIAHAYLLDGVAFELSKRGRLRSGERIPKRALPNDIADALATVHAQLRSHLGPLPAAELQALGRLCGRCLAIFLEATGPISMKRMLLNMRRIPDALDRQFPGYLAAGLLPWLWRSYDTEKNRR